MYFINTICTNQYINIVVTNSHEKMLKVWNQFRKKKTLFPIKTIKYIFIQDDQNDIFESTFPKERSKTGGEQSLFQANKNLKKGKLA